MAKSTTPCPVCQALNFWDDYMGVEGRRMKETGECFQCAYWSLSLKKHPEVVIDYGTYSIGREPPLDENGRLQRGVSSEGLGMAGRRFDIEFFDGRKVVTHNLWFGGVIPERFRDRVSNNARFLDGAERVQVGETTCFNPSAAPPSPDASRSRQEGSDV